MPIWWISICLSIHPSLLWGVRRKQFLKKNLFHFGFILYSALLAAQQNQSGFRNYIFQLSIRVSDLPADNSECKPLLAKMPIRCCKLKIRVLNGSGFSLDLSAIFWTSCLCLHRNTVMKKKYLKGMWQLRCGDIKGNTFTLKVTTRWHFQCAVKNWDVILTLNDATDNEASSFITIDTSPLKNIFSCIHVQSKFVQV